MNKFIGNNNGNTIKSKNIDLFVVANPVQTLISSATAGEIFTKDSTFIFSPSSTVDAEFSLEIDFAGDLDLSESISFSSSDESIATVDQDGLVKRVADGNIEITIDSFNTKRKLDLFVERQSNASSTTFDTFVDLSFSKYHSDLIDDAIANETASIAIPMYSSGNVRNPDCWVADYADLSCQDREKPAATFIGNSGGFSYAIQVEHFPSNSDTYVAMDGTVESMAVAQAVNIGLSNANDFYASDIRVVRYSSQLSDKFVPAILPPAEILQSVPGFINRFPLIITNQEKEIFVVDGSTYDRRVTFRTPTDSKRLEFNKRLITGDSGSGCYMLLPTTTGNYTHRLMYICGLTFGGAGGGPEVSNNLDDIQTAIESFGGTWSDFEFADFSAFPKYINFNRTTPVLFDAAQDAGSVTIISDDEINLTGNPWKKIDLEKTYNITTGGRLKFDFKGTDFGEIAAVYLTTADAFRVSHATDLIFFLGGTTPLTANSTNILDHYDNSLNDGTYRTYEIDLGQYTGKSFNKIVFIGNDDADASTNISFRNVEIQNKAFSISAEVDVPVELRTGHVGTVGHSFITKRNITIYKLKRKLTDTSALNQIHQLDIWDTTTQLSVANVEIGPTSAIDGDFVTEFLTSPFKPVIGRRYIFSSSETNDVDSDRYMNRHFSIINTNDFEDGNSLRPYFGSGVGNPYPATASGNNNSRLTENIFEYLVD